MDDKKPRKHTLATLLSLPSEYDEEHQLLLPQKKRKRVLKHFLKSDSSDSDNDNNNALSQPPDTTQQNTNNTYNTFDTLDNNGTPIPDSLIHNIPSPSASRDALRITKRKKRRLSFQLWVIRLLELFLLPWIVPVLFLVMPLYLTLSQDPSYPKRTTKAVLKEFGIYQLIMLISLITTTFSVAPLITYSFVDHGEIHSDPNSNHFSVSTVTEAFAPVATYLVGFVLVLIVVDTDPLSLLFLFSDYYKETHKSIQKDVKHSNGVQSTPRQDKPFHTDANSVYELLYRNPFMTYFTPGAVILLFIATACHITILLYPHFISMDINKEETGHSRTVLILEAIVWFGGTLSSFFNFGLIVVLIFIIAQGYYKHLLTLKDFAKLTKKDPKHRTGRRDQWRGSDSSITPLHNDGRIVLPHLRLDTLEDVKLWMKVRKRTLDQIRYSKARLAGNSYHLKVEEVLGVVVLLLISGTIILIIDSIKLPYLTIRDPKEVFRGLVGYDIILFSIALLIITGIGIRINVNQRKHLKIVLKAKEQIRNRLLQKIQQNQNSESPKPFQELSCVMELQQLLDYLDDVFHSIDKTDSPPTVLGIELSPTTRTFVLGLILTTMLPWLMALN